MKTGIIGCGGISAVHVYSVLESGHSVTALCDIEEERAEGLKRRFGIKAAFYADYRELIASGAVDCVHICTPHYLHAEMIIYALRRGINVFAEKPLAITRESLREVRKTAESSGAVLGVCHQNRYLPANAELKRLTEGRLPEFAYGSVRWRRGKDYYDSGEWRGTVKMEGGGVMINQALHTLDLMAWYMGKACRVEASLSNRHLKGVIEVEDTAELCVDFGGRRGLFYATTAAGADYPVELEIMLGGDRYRLCDGLYKNGKLIKSNDAGFPPDKACWGVGHPLIVRDFYNSLCENKPFAIGVEDGINAVELVLSAYENSGFYLGREY